MAQMTPEKPHSGVEGGTCGRGWLGRLRQKFAALRPPGRDGVGRRQDQHAGDCGLRAATGLDAKCYTEVPVVPIILRGSTK